MNFGSSASRTRKACVTESLAGTSLRSLRNLFCCNRLSWVILTLFEEGFFPAMHHCHKMLPTPTPRPCTSVFPLFQTATPDKMGSNGKNWGSPEKTMSPLPPWARFYFYGMHGLLDEVVFTALFDLFLEPEGNRHLRGCTTITSFFIYGSCTFLVEQIFLYCIR